MEVFNTSEPQHRFEDLEARTRRGEAADDLRWHLDLQAYLKGNIHAADVYVLLVSPRCLEKHSRWVAFEVQTVLDASDHILRFLPCVLGGLDPDHVFQDGFFRDMDFVHWTDISTDYGRPVLKRTLQEAYERKLTGRPRLGVPGRGARHDEP